ncbi:MAG: transcription-repair coupling factor [Dehalococcoidia bacterium]|nr:transcription-repair coupling factor [Dehalococcoidia bacterium]
MKISVLLGLLRDCADFQKLVASLEHASAQALVIEDAKPYLLAALFSELKRPMLVVTAQPDKTRKMAEQLSVWLGGEAVTQIPGPDNLPYACIATDAVSAMERLQALSKMVYPAADSKLPLILAQVPALMQKMPSASVFRSGWITLRCGMELNPLKLAERLLSLGYRKESLTEVPGSFSRHGDILDIFLPTEELPVRMEYFGNSVERMRYFDSLSQRSLKAVEEVVLGPASETAACFSGGAGALHTILSKLDLKGLNTEARSKLEADIELTGAGHLPMDIGSYAALFNEDILLSYLPPRCLVVLDGPGRIEDEAVFFSKEHGKAFAEKVERREYPDTFPTQYFTWDELCFGLERAQRLELPDLYSANESEALRLSFAFAKNYAGQLASWMERVKELSADNKRVVAVSHQAERLSELLGNEGLLCSVKNELVTMPPRGSVTLVQGIISSGWEWREEVYLFSDRELFGFLKQQRFARKRPIAHHKLFNDLKPGDYVVHVEHGVSRFNGVTTMQAGGIIREYMLLEYADGDRLYVPTDQIDRIERYVGAADHAPSLNRLGSQEWIRSKDKARESAEDLAEDLLKIYAARETALGFAYSEDNIWQTELEASFPYVETPDQLNAIEQIKEDMSRPRPMDRLICGDVGYGKTEVALRAAFKAIQDGKQVAMLVPTTVLAQQHYATFQERLAAFPIRVESLSRFKSLREQKEIVEAIEAGSVDIAIGTHRLLQKDVKFKDLGLLIVDEEQRFGVSHKEHFKALRHEIDVLTLSATPIPRTLNLSLVGVRDMSVMETPPSERLPINTYVAEYSEQLVREAIVRELERKGQVFFVHNRIQSINLLSDKLSDLVPEARIAVGHGQMPEDELEMVMAQFASGDVDVLLCTTIIESGLDVPNANTLIINQSDRLGLTQLYQLRGRVGRGANTAYAYFLYDKGKRLAQDANQRLQTIYKAAELGAGFGIAMSDLEIRGAGNILGARQSGHVNAVGFNLFTQLLAEAVDDMKSKKAAQRENKPFIPTMRLPVPTINLPQAAFIPDSYVADTDTRLSLYKRLASAKNLEMIDVAASDFKDRFGELPQEVQNLLFAIRVKVLAISARLESVSTEAENIVLRRPAGMQFPMEAGRLAMQGVKVSINQVRLDTGVLKDGWRETLETVLKQLCGKESTHLT